MKNCSLFAKKMFRKIFDFLGKVFSFYSRIFRAVENHICVVYTLLRNIQKKKLFKHLEDVTTCIQHSNKLRVESTRKRVKLTRLRVKFTRMRVVF
jgi:hypothetical protein